MSETFTKKVIPHSEDAEKSIIGSMLMEKEAIDVAVELLTGDDFYGRQYGILFDTIKDMHNHNINVDIVTLAEKLENKDMPEEYRSAGFLKDLITSQVILPGNAGEYAKIVKEKSVLRRLIKANNAISDECYSGKKKLNDVLDDAEKQIFDIIQSRNVTETANIYEIVTKVIGNLEDLADSGNRGKTTGIPTGFSDLDYMTAGFQKSDLILIAARPAMGKTAFELNLAEHMCFREGKTVALFSLEMSKEQLVTRLLSMGSGVESEKLKKADLEVEEWARLVEYSAIIGNSNLIIDDTPGITISELRSKCRRFKMENDLDIVMIDYLQLMSAGGKRESRQQEISEISRSLKALARELNIPVVALSQLSRAVETRDKKDRRPMLSDLRESGAIEQDADIVMFLYRDDYYNKESPKKDIAEVIIAKQRNGAIGTVELAWLSSFTKFKNLTKSERDRMLLEEQ